MKPVFYLLFCALHVISCKNNSANTLDDSQSFSPEERFFASVQSRPPADIAVYVTVNPSHCGACNDEFIDYVKKLNTQVWPVTFLMSAEDPKISAVLQSIKNSKTLYPSYENMERHGLTGPYNKIYLLHGNKVFFSEMLQPENSAVIDTLLAAPFPEKIFRQ